MHDVASEFASAAKMHRNNLRERPEGGRTQFARKLLLTQFSACLRTFKLIVSAHPYCARKFTCHVMLERALSHKINK